MGIDLPERDFRIASLAAARTSAHSAFPDNVTGSVQLPSGASSGSDAIVQGLLLPRPIWLITGIKDRSMAWRLRPVPPSPPALRIYFDAAEEPGKRFRV